MSERGAPFAVGRAIGEIFSVWLRRLGAFALLCAIVLLPLTGYRVWLSLGSLSPAKLRTHDHVTLFVWLVLSSIAIGAASRGVLELLRGRGVPIGGSLVASLRRAPHAVGAHLPVAVAWTSSRLVLDQALLWRAVSLVVVYAVIVTMWVAVPVAMVERADPFAAWRRSAELTRGNRLRILVLVLLVFLALGGVALLQARFDGDVRVYWAANVVSSALAMSLYAVATAVSYHQLRRAHEGVEVEDLAKVFD